MDQCSGHDIPPAICLLADRRGHDLELDLDLQAWLDECSPDGGSDPASCRSLRRCSPIRLTPMPALAPLSVQVIGYTHFEPPADVPWETDAEGGQALAEFAGRACYQSWNKPNPATATNAGYLRHILEVGHLSVLEHGSVTFYLTGISRSLTHELIRHRHFSYSQLSQRYVPERDAAMVEPAVIAEDPELHAQFLAAGDAALAAYEGLLEGLEKKFADVENVTSRRKQARQAARAVLPNATETRIVVTGNYRAMRHFVAMRASEHADVEIRELAIAVLRELQRVAPSVFADFTDHDAAGRHRGRRQPARRRGLAPARRPVWPPGGVVRSAARTSRQERSPAAPVGPHLQEASCCRRSTPRPPSSGWCCTCRSACRPDAPGAHARYLSGH